MTTILVVGGTGGIGHLVVAEALREGYTTRALVRNRAKASRLLPDDAHVVVADVTRPETLPPAVEGVNAVILTLGSERAEEAERVDYGGVRNVLAALGGRRVRVVLMTAVGLTGRAGSFGQLLDWKRRSERLVRASGQPYTIVRPGWFDYNDAGQHRLVALQGDPRHTGTPADGAVARRQIAQVLVHAVGSDEAVNKTLELISETGPATIDFDEFFAPLERDPQGSLDGVRDARNMPLDQEPAAVRHDLAAVAGR
ncbi:uncharacterized protein YbjT (DUF2867 family) [Arthrobacter sp. UYP6]|uniref:SDR family oxidoreductase n=1 Tax=Arthrobacter sp. UYP6 TaxID=1756378 RepID=UPI0033981912